MTVPLFGRAWCTQNAGRSAPKCEPIGKTPDVIRELKISAP
jgi:hypothetical protein